MIVIRDITKEQLKTALLKHKLQKDVAKELNTYPSRLSYLIKLYNLEEFAPNRNFRIKKTNPLCRICGETDSSKFYKTSLAVCKKCKPIQVKINRQSFRKQLIDYKGGKCIVCGYSKIYALDFHYVDATKKDFQLVTKMYRKRKDYIEEDIKKELDKCVLLCANCHREYHAGVLQLPV